jgi:hypothetical protein
MRVKFEDREYSIEFRYEWVKGSLADGYALTRMGAEDARERTKCLIRDRDPALIDSNGQRPVVAQALVVRYYKDTPNREKARKAALAKALESLDLDAVGCQPPYIHQFKSRRRAFWEAYLNRARKPVAESAGVVGK